MNIWWCNQRSSWAIERKASVVCSSEDADNLTFRKTVGEVAAGDIILHYVTPDVVAVSLAKSDGRHYSRLPLLGDIDYNAGWRVEVEYFVFYPVIPKEKFADRLIQLRDHAARGFPIDRNGNVRQGYVFPFSTEGLKVLQESSETVWPAWA